jgi:hypothetical protein
MSNEGENSTTPEDRIAEADELRVTWQIMADFAGESQRSRNRSRYGKRRQAGTEGAGRGLTWR